MEQKSFIVFVTAGGKPIVNPMVCLCETHDEARDLAITDLATKLPSLPMGTLLHIFDTDSEVTYLGEPKEPEQDEESESESPEELAGAKPCECPTGGTCPMRDAATGACKFETESQDVGCQCSGCAGEPCAEPVEDLGPGFPEEGRVYEPHELLFAIGPYDHPDLIPGMKFVVYLTIAEDFEKTGEQTDDLGGHNVDNDALRAAGVCECEAMESVFEVNPRKGDTREALVERMIEAGFGYRQSFQDFIDSCIDA